MRKISSHIICGSILLILVVMSSACVNTLELAVPNGEQGISHQSAVANAKAYFDIHFGQNTRSNNQTPTEEAPYVVGNLVPDWESGVTVANSEKVYSDFAMQKDFRYFLLLGEEGDEQMQAVELYSRFVSVSEIGSDITSQYIITYIPSEEYLYSYGAVAQDYGINCSDNHEFSGVMLYTLPSGHHIAAYRYEEGKFVGGSFLYNEEQTEEENIADFVAVVEDLRIGVVEMQEGTRSDALYGGTIQEIVFVYDTGFPIFIIDNTNTGDTGNRLIDPIANDHFTLGGGGGGTTTTEKEELTGEDIAEGLFDTKDLSEEEQKALSKMLEEIYEDCMGKALIVTMLSKNTKIPIEFNYNTRAGYNYSSGIRLNNTHSESLLHELFHAYQYSQLGSTSYNSTVANIEVEAYLATFYYMKRSDNPEVLQRCDNFKRRKLGSRAPLLYEILDNRAYANPNADLTRFMTIYMIEARVIKSDYDRKHRELGDGKVMGINEEQAFEDSVKNIQSISGECDVNKE